MQQLSVLEIKELAKSYSLIKANWHFHILTPECQLNKTDKYVLAIENIDSDMESVCYSNKPYMGIGQELVRLLHGDDVIKKNDEKSLTPSSLEVKKLLNRAKELIKIGKFWHHHMLFPGCRYNKHKDRWVIVFEDKEKNEIIESISFNEPKSDLQHIEKLFYSQKK